MAEISTGYETEITPCNNLGSGPNYLGKYIFSPDHYNGSTFSRAVKLPPNKFWVIDCYNFPMSDAYNIKTHRALIGSWDSPTIKDMCDPCNKEIFAKEAEVLSYKPMTLGDPSKWIFDQNKTQMIITIPGAYIFEINNSTIFSSEPRFFMTYLEYDLENAGNIPWQYQGGLG